MNSRLVAALGVALALAVPAAADADSSAPSLPTVPTLIVGPPTYTVLVNKAAGAPGDVFYTTGFSAAAVGPQTAASPVLSALQPSKLVIAHKDGSIVWEHQAPQGEDVNNFRVQTYQGRRVLTWWQGTVEGGHGSGADYIADSQGRIIKKLELPDGFTPDTHEFRITPDGRALLTSYKLTTGDLSGIGGPVNGSFYDSYAFVVDIASGKVLQKWDALAHIPVTDTTYPQTLPLTDDYDPFHINSISLDHAGDLVISFRDLSAVYDVSATTGAVNWVLGGKHPTLTAGPGVSFGFQHDAEFISPTTLQLFNDNASGPLKADGPSSVQRIAIDPAGHRATLVSNWTHPDGVTAFAMGNAQPLADGHVFVSWGTAPRISEFSPTGTLLYDAALPTGTYRAFLDIWPDDTTVPATTSATSARRPLPHRFVNRWSRRNGPGSISPTRLSASGRDAGATVTYAWFAGSRLLAQGRAPGLAVLERRAATTGAHVVRARVVVTAPGYLPRTRTITVRLPRTR